MKTKLKILMAGAISIMLSAAFFSGTSQAAVIDFNGVDNTTWHVRQNPYSEQGFTLTNNESISYEAAGMFWYRESDFNADPDGATYSHNYSDTTTTLTKDNEGTFDFNTIDLGDVYNNAVGGNVRFVFTRGSSDEIISVALDTLVGLETFIFNESGVDSVKWTPLTTDGHFLQLDNITLGNPPTFDTTNFDHGRQVPEPSTLLLLGTGFVTLALGGRKLINCTE